MERSTRLLREKPFDEGTAFVVKAVKNNKNKNFFSVAGGGDTISLLKQNNVFQYFSFISTGGGAFLNLLKEMVYLVWIA